jgi:hypothetical protein
VSDHSCRMALSGLFGHCRVALLIPNAVMQNYPDQVTKRMGNHPMVLLCSGQRNMPTTASISSRFAQLNVTPVTDESGIEPFPLQWNA